MSYQHTPVLLQEVLNSLEPRPGRNFVDGTVGGGGHARAILEATAPKGKLLAFDRDPRAISAATLALAKFSDRVTFINDSYSNIATYVERSGISRLDGVLLDLGWSSDQLQDASRGFSFQVSAPLDLRFNPTVGVSAAELLQVASAKELEDIFRGFGEEPKARQLAQTIVETRRAHPLVTTTDLLDVVSAVKGRGRRSLHPATLVWQALRIAVNNEVDELAKGLNAAFSCLASGGRLVVISFHSGEDRLVKQWFRSAARLCTCPPESPTCRCGRKAKARIVTRKPVVASPAESVANPRANSAKLRVLEKLI